MNTIKNTFCLLILLTVNCAWGEEDEDVDEIPSNNITCYRCNNINLPKPKCVNAPAEGVSGGEVEEVYSIEEEQCSTVTEFLEEHDLITPKWMKNHLKKARETTTSSHDLSTNSITASLQAYCATVVISTSEEAVPQVFRDCIKGNPERIKRNFVNNFEYNGKNDFKMPETGSKKCNSKNSKMVGFHRINICLCQSDKCNNEFARISGCDQVIMAMPIKLFLLSFFLTTLSKLIF